MFEVRKDESYRIISIDYLLFTFTFHKNDDTFFSETSLRAISENLESKLASKTETEAESKQYESEEMEKRNIASSSKSHRKSKSISQPAGSQRLSMRNAYDTVELRTPIKKEMTSKENEYGKKCNKMEEKSSNAQTKEELLGLFKSILLKKYGIIMMYQW